MATSDFLKRISELSPKRLALLALELQNKLDVAERQKNDPIAIIGMGCRLPGGANTPDEYWELLLNGVDAITEVPPDRWDADANFDPDPEAIGKIATRWGGFIQNVDQFDPQFFGIAPREAMSMDPQQRMLLEVAWEALENAGYAPDKLAGSATGVFVGICNGDYYHLITEAGGDNIDAYLATGSAHSVASGRVSYVLGLQGPSLSVDTACSSSLVSIHLAVQSLRTGECDLALAGGVNLVLALNTTMALSRAGMMASDGRCKAFDSRADGFVRSEGCGMIVLKRLSEAQKDGDNILAVIRGSAINQDGRSNGLTAPNGPSQESVIRAALADAKIEPSEVSYIETHGTGTSLGDPIEVQALGAAIGRAHTAENPLMIGAAKTNLGHLESAAGVAGLMKLVLMLQHGEIPPHLHLEELSPFIPWGDFPVIVPTERTAWNGKRIGGVSSFGFSGTNAHLILEAAPVPTPNPSPSQWGGEKGRGLNLLALSAKSENALKELASRYVDYFAVNPDVSLADAAYTANIGRGHFAHRLTLTAAYAGQARDTLAAWLNNAGGASENTSEIIAGQGRGRPDIAFLFTGQGAQYVQMGRQLYETEPVFRDAINKCDELAQPQLKQSLLSVLYPENDDASPIQDIEYAQPAQFAIEYALSELWRSWGIEPTVVMGHSVGEYAAAVVAGIFSLEDGLKLVIARGRLMATTAPGSMAAVFADRERVAVAIAPYKGKVSIASLNGAEITVISGEKEAIQAVIDDLKPQKIRARRLEVSIAGHSPLMDPIIAEFGRIAATVTYSQPQIEYVSGMTGGFVKDIPRADYWRRHLREAVQFYPAMQTLHHNNTSVFVEIGPAPDLLSLGQRCLPDGYGLWLPSLRPGTEDGPQMFKSLSALYVNGANVDWSGVIRHEPHQRLPLPTYPFQRQSYWFQVNAPKRPAHRTQSGDSHPLLGQRLRSSVIKDIVFETHLGATWPSFLDHHRIYGIVILPSPAYLEMALGAAKEAFGRGSYSVRDFTIQEALVLPEDGERTIQIVLSPMANGASSFQVLSLVDEVWKLNATGNLTLNPSPQAERDFTLAPMQEVFEPGDVQARCTEEISGEVYYDKIRALGLEFGSDFRGITRLWRRDGEALAEVRLPDALNAEAGQYGIHPAFLDACLHLLGAPLPDDDLETAYLLIGIESFQLYRSPGKMLWNHTVIEEPLSISPPLARGGAGGEVFTGTVKLYDEYGDLVAEIGGLQLKRAGREALMRAVHRRPDDWFYEVAWEEKPHPNPIMVTGSAAHLPTPPELAEKLQPLMTQLSIERGLDDYPTMNQAVDEVGAIYIARALAALGWDFHVGCRISASSLMDQAKPQHRRFLKRLLDILREDGILRRVGDEWHVMEVPENMGDPQAAMHELMAQYPDYRSQLVLMERCASQLAEVLSGQIDPLHLLFPGGSLDDLEAVYQETPYAQVYNTLIQEAIQTALQNLPQERQLRILEIGAGTGATTAYVVPVLPSKHVEYVFTDLSPLFLEHAKEKFRDFPSMRYRLLDIEREPTIQGFAPQSFDIVIAANVLHATADLRHTMEHVKSLIAPGGLVMILEGLKAARWVDLTFGMTEGWWKFTDTKLRPDYPLLSRWGWLDLLRSSGLNDATAITNWDGVAGMGILLAHTSHMEASMETSEVRAALSAERTDWLIFADNKGYAEALINRLSARGEIGAVVLPSDHYQSLHHSWTVNPANPDDFRRLIEEANPQRGVVVITCQWSDETTLDTLKGEMNRYSAEVLHLAQAMAASEQKPILWLVTESAQAVDSAPNGFSLATMWGWGRVIALEHPEIWGGVIDIDMRDAPYISAAEIFTEITQPDGEDQMAWREGRRYVARLAPHPFAPPLARGGVGGGVLQPDASYLITGGLGGLGLKVARWMAENGAGHIVLTGRRGLPPRENWDLADETIQPQIHAIREIEKLGTQVIVESADVSDMGQMRKIFARFDHGLPPLRGVIHAAAALDFWPVQDMPLDGVKSMFAPKVMGTWILHELTQHLSLDFFALFSSTTALWGVTNMAHYAAANTFMDSFAHYRRALGLPALSINWGTWEEMRVASAEDQESIAQFGLKKMPSDQALAILGDLISGTDVAQIAVASVDWAALKPLYEARRERPFLALVGIKPVAMPETEVGKPQLLDELANVRAEERYELIENYVREQVARVLGIADPLAIDASQGMFEMGMDSLMSVELKGRLEKVVGQSLPSTLTFNYPTVAELTEYFDTRVLATPEPVKDAVVEIPKIETPTETDLSDDLSEDELEALLMKKLKGLK